MRHRKSGRQLNRNSSHRKAMFKNMANSLFEHETIRTTLPKAKELRSYYEKLITKASANDFNSHRAIFAMIQDKACTNTIVTEIAPKYAERTGGYTRITRTRIRRGDATTMAFIELV